MATVGSFLDTVKMSLLETVWPLAFGIQAKRAPGRPLGLQVERRAVGICTGRLGHHNHLKAFVP